MLALIRSGYVIIERILGLDGSPASIEHIGLFAALRVHGAIRDGSCLIHFLVLGAVLEAASILARSQRILPLLSVVLEVLLHFIDILVYSFPCFVILNALGLVVNGSTVSVSALVDWGHVRDVAA